MDLANPLATVTSPLVGAVIRALSGTTSAASGGQVHRLAELGSKDGVRKVLHGLVAQGIVLVEEHPHANLYRLNRDHVTAAPLLALSHTREELLGRLSRSIESWPHPPRHASVFGSFARGEADETSDIDVVLFHQFAVGPAVVDPHIDDWLGQVDGLIGDIERWTGNRAHVVDVSERQLVAMLKAGDPLLESWRREHVHLTGERLRDVLRSVAERGGH